MKRLLIGLTAILSLSFAQEHGDWCPAGKKLNSTVYVEGIVDYEDINWCKVVITLPASKLELYYTRDGKLVRVMEFKGNKKRAEVDFKNKNIDVRVFDPKGEVFEEFKSKETF